jgi:hypothetical protein
VVSLLSPPRVSSYDVPVAKRVGDQYQPKRFLPVEPATLIVSHDGGVLNIEGVEVVERDRSWPPFQRGETYLMFLGVNSEGVADVDLTLGVYLLSGSDTLVPVAGVGHREQKEIQALSGGSLSRLRTALWAGGYVQ